MTSKRVTSLVLVLIAVGTSAVWWGSSRGDIRNSEPVHLPLPGQGFVVSQSFHLATGGRFALQIGSPATPAELKMLHREQPDVSCDVEVVVTGPHALNLRRRITSLHNGGWNDQNLFYPDQLFVLPGGGDYEITFRSNAVPDVFSKRGATVTLQRWENVGSAIGWGLAVWLGYGILACGLAMTAVLRWRQRTHSPEPRDLTSS